MSGGDLPYILCCTDLLIHVSVYDQCGLRLLSDIKYEFACDVTCVYWAALLSHLPVLTGSHVRQQH